MPQGILACFVRAMCPLGRKDLSPRSWRTRLCACYSNWTVAGSFGVAKHDASTMPTRCQHDAARVTVPARMRARARGVATQERCNQTGSDFPAARVAGFGEASQIRQTRYQHDARTMPSTMPARCPSGTTRCQPDASTMPSTMPSTTTRCQRDTQYNNTMPTRCQSIESRSASMRSTRSTPQHNTPARCPSTIPQHDASATPARAAQAADAARAGIPRMQDIPHT